MIVSMAITMVSITIKRKKSLISKCVAFNNVLVVIIINSCVHSTMMEYRPIYEIMGSFFMYFAINKIATVPMIPVKYRMTKET